MDDGPRIYLFGDVRIEPEAHRLFRGGALIEIEPKAFAVLLQFLEHPQELLDRNRLLDAVWGHRHVGPAALNRVIAILRRALGDDADEPRYIETVHGLGYRFAIAPSRSRGAIDGMRSSVVAADDGSADCGGAGAVGTDHLESAVHVSPRAPSFAERNRTLIVAGTSALLLMTALGAMFAVRHPTDSTAAQETPAVAKGAAPRIAVMPFTARDGDAELRAVAEGLSESLTDAFTRSGGLRVAGRESALALGRGQANPQRVAEVLGVDYVLGGEITTVGSALKSNIELRRRGEAAPVWVDQQESPRGQLFRIVVPLIDHVRRTLLSEVKPEPKPLDVSVSTQDLYWLGRHYWYLRTPDDLARALGYFQSAVNENPKFAQAWCGIADSYMLLNEYADLSLDEASAKARAAVARAREIEPELAEAYASEGLILMDELKYENAVKALASAVELEPNQPYATVWYGTALAYSGHPSEALKWHEKTEQLDPLNAIVQTYLGVDYLLLGERELATGKFQHALELNPDYSEPYWQMALENQLHGHIANSVSVLSGATRLRGAIDWSMPLLAYGHLLLGDGRRALEALSKLQDISPNETIEPRILALWLSGQETLAQAILDGVEPGLVSRPAYTAARARLLLLRGNDKDALKVYNSLFAAKPEQGDPFLRLWLPDMGLGHYAAWIALMPQDDPVRMIALRSYSAQIERMEDAGMDLPALHYQHAVVAALQDNATEAESQLARAQADGWLDASAFDRDPAWRPFAKSPWLAKVRADQSIRVAAEKAVIARRNL